MSQFSNKDFDSFRVKLNRNIGREKALDEALKLLNQSDITSDDAVEYNKRVDKKSIIRQIKHKSSSSDINQEKLDTIIELLEQANFSSEDTYRITKKRRLASAMGLIFVGIFIVVVGVLIIVVDPPDYLKGPTVIYFNPNDGVTLSDLVALTIIGLASFCFVWSYVLMQKR